MQNAKLYARYNSLSLRQAEQLLQEFLPRMRWACEEAAGAKAAALDVGCGPGDLTAKVLRPRLLPSIKSLVGVDVNSEMVNHASAHYRDQGLHFVLGDITTSELHSTPLGREASAVGGFCKVFSFYTLHWIQDHRAALDNVHRLLREGGECFLCFLSHSPVYAAYEQLMRQSRWAPYMTDAKKYISPYQHAIDAAIVFSLALQKAGFKVKYCRTHSFKHHMDSEDFRGLVEAVNPFVKRVPEKDQPEFVEETILATQKAVLHLAEDGEEDVGPNTIYHYTLVAHVEKPKLS